jgi:hypothetical protein
MESVEHFAISFASHHAEAATFKNASQPEVTVTQARRRLPPPHLNLKQAGFLKCLRH